MILQIYRFFIKLFRRIYILYKMTEIIDCLNNEIFNLNVEDIDFEQDSKN